MYRTLVYYLYHGTLPDEQLLNSWNAERPHAWGEGRESYPPSCSLALKLYTLGEQSVSVWGSLEDAMVSFIFYQYREQRIAPIYARVEQLYEDDVRY